MQHENFLPCSQELASGHYPQPVKTLFRNSHGISVKSIALLVSTIRQGS
jgi:hypothetical protein